MASLQAADDRKSAAGSLAQRAKQPSAGGDMAAFSPASGTQRELPTIGYPRAIRQLGGGPLLDGRIVEEKYGQISELGAVVAHRLVSLLSCCKWPRSAHCDAFLSAGGYAGSAFSTFFFVNLSDECREAGRGEKRRPPNNARVEICQTRLVRTSSDR